MFEYQTQRMTSELFIVSLVFLLLVLVILLVLCWVLRRSRGRKLTELRVSAGQPIRFLTIRVEPDHAKQLLDHLLNRIFFHVETEQESIDELQEEPGAERKPEEERGSDSEPEASTSTNVSFSGRAVSFFQDDLWKWITVKVRPADDNEATPPPPPPPPPPPSPSQDQTNNLSRQSSDTSQHASSSQEASCSELWEGED